jgi:hypothetical protein
MINIRRCLFMLVFVGGLVGHVGEASACAGFGDWLAEFLQGQQQLIENVIIDGTAVVSSVMTTTIQTLGQLYNQNPAAFKAFVNNCLDDTAQQLSPDIISTLQKFGLIGSDGKISDTIKLIVGMAIEQLDDGTDKIWTLDELVADKWVTVTRQRA